jgi:hypothetical protein
VPYGFNSTGLQVSHGQRLMQIVATVVDPTQIYDDKNLKWDTRTRRVGQQVTPWSCVPASLEILNMLWDGIGPPPVLQDGLLGLCSTLGWQFDDKAHKHPRLLMPHDMPTCAAILAGMRVKAVNGLDIEMLLRDLNFFHGGDWGVLAEFGKFSIPGEKGSRAHACILYSWQGRPAYEATFLTPTTNVGIARYSYSWNKVQRMIPRFTLISRL